MTSEARAQQEIIMESVSSVRIACLLPSLTEVVSRFPSLKDKIVAVTHECDYPSDVVTKALRVTTSDINPHTMEQAEIDRRVRGSLAMGHSLYGLDEEKLKQADPTIVFTQALCEVCAPSYPMVISTCSKLLGDDPKVVNIEPTCLADVLESVRTVGAVTGQEEEAEALVDKLQAQLDKIQAAVKGRPRPKVAFLEWMEPLFNGGHWIPDMLDIAGADYSLAKATDRSMQITPEQLAACDPDVILCGPCGFDKERAAKDTAKLWAHEWWRQLRAVKAGKVYALDGNAYYARPGPRLVQGTGVIARILHGDEVLTEGNIGEDIVPREWIVVTGGE